MGNESTYTWPCFTKKFFDTDNLGLLGHGVDTELLGKGKKRPEILGRKQPTSNNCDSYLWMKSYSISLLTVFTNSPGSTVYRFFIYRNPRGQYSVQLPKPDQENPDEIDLQAIGEYQPSLLKAVRQAENFAVRGEA